MATATADDVPQVSGHVPRMKEGMSFDPKGATWVCTEVLTVGGPAQNTNNEESADPAGKPEDLASRAGTEPDDNKKDKEADNKDKEADKPFKGPILKESEKMAAETAPVKPEVKAPDPFESDEEPPMAKRMKSLKP